MPAISARAPQNNLGGVQLGGSAQNAQLATVTNYCAKPLIISAIQIAEGSTDFSLLGLPSDLATNPITLATGQSFTFGVAFAALGLAAHSST